VKLRFARFAALGTLAVASAVAASHRNGPFLLEDQTANLNDFYLFRSYKQTKSDSMNAQGFQNPDRVPATTSFLTACSTISISTIHGAWTACPISRWTLSSTPRSSRIQRSYPYFGKIDSIDSDGIFLYQTLQNRLGSLGGDNAGWPFGGRRPNDDVVDIGLRAAAGSLVSGFWNQPPLGDGVNSNDVPTLDHFPLHAPHAGFRHSQGDGTNGRAMDTGN
jgi:hypothetical protein